MIYYKQDLLDIIAKLDIFIKICTFYGGFDFRLNLTIITKVSLSVCIQ